MRPEILKHLNSWLGPADKVVHFSPQSGGDTSAVWRIHTNQQREMVVKTNTGGHGDSFEAERNGLLQISATNTIRTPNIMTMSTSPNYLVLEAIQTRDPDAIFWEKTGHALAALHRADMGHQYGWSSDNCIGPSPQRNDFTNDWSRFWLQYRLVPQIRWARQKSLLDGTLESLLETLIDRIDEWIITERPCLIHGDLWSGNLLCSDTGEPVVIDPAVYLGHREADLSMTTLFGGFPTRFYDAYQEVWPLSPGWRERLQFYGLYHWLNHLNAFGMAYHAQCTDTLRSLLR